VLDKVASGREDSCLDCSKDEADVESNSSSNPADVWGTLMMGGDIRAGWSSKEQVRAVSKGRHLYRVDVSRDRDACSL
jgi:hypothetical protein